MSNKNVNLPIVYSCSGCSSVAQMSNYIALQFDKLGVAEMSCIVGVGGDVPHLLKTARSGRPIIALDGCPLACTKACLARHGIEPDSYHQLNEYSVKKIYHADFDLGQAQTVLALVLAKVEEKYLSLPQ
ncbi:MAG: putative zinc-binding protein [Methylotenera sp.]|nr:putative zinc-binding protein [Methylotenera sp.]